VKLSGLAGQQGDSTDRQPSLDTASDEALAARAQAGCRQSFEQLCQRFQVPLVHFLRRHASSHEDAEDLVQEALVRAYHNLYRYQATWRFATWLFTIARRLQINHLQKLDRRPQASADTALAVVAAEQPEPGERLASEEQRRKLWDTAAEILDEPKFTALWLFYIEEMPVAEVAKVLDLSRGAVKTMMSRARRQLIPHLKNFWESREEMSKARGQRQPAAVGNGK
jgi:RNA polymerase sigma-70 factor (ECF subfamily)